MKMGEGRQKTEDKKPERDKRKEHRGQGNLADKWNPKVKNRLIPI